MGSMPSDRPGHYRTLSIVAGNVSAAAALAAQQQGEHRRSVDRVSGSRVSDDVDEFSAMADSFHSEGGLTPSRKRVSWSTERYGKRGGSVGRTPLSRSTFLPHAAPAEQAGDAIDRGRSLQRDADQEVLAEPSAQSASVDSHRRSSRASRRGANLVFLGVFALFGVGTWTSNRSGILHGRDVNVGRVLTAPPMGLAAPPPVPVLPINHVQFVRSDNLPPHEPHHDPIPTNPSNERALGRFFAWLCTTLYLTSRLPQIWKNVRFFSLMVYRVLIHIS